MQDSVAPNAIGPLFRTRQPQQPGKMGGTPFSHQHGVPDLNGSAIAFIIRTTLPTDPMAKLKSHVERREREAARLQRRLGRDQRSDAAKSRVSVPFTSSPSSGATTPKRNVAGCVRYHWARHDQRLPRAEPFRAGQIIAHRKSYKHQH